MQEYDGNNNWGSNKLLFRLEKWHSDGLTGWVSELVECRGKQFSAMTFG